MELCLSVGQFIQLFTDTSVICSDELCELLRPYLLELGFVNAYEFLGYLRSEKSDYMSIRRGRRGGSSPFAKRRYNMSAADDRRTFLVKACDTDEYNDWNHLESQTWARSRERFKFFRSNSGKDMRLYVVSEGYGSAKPEYNDLALRWRVFDRFQTRLYTVDDRLWPVPKFVPLGNTEAHRGCWCVLEIRVGDQPFLGLDVPSEISTEQEGTTNADRADEFPGETRYDGKWKERNSLAHLPLLIQRWLRTENPREAGWLPHSRDVGFRRHPCSVNVCAVPSLSHEVWYWRIRLAFATRPLSFLPGFGKCPILLLQRAWRARQARHVGLGTNDDERRILAKAVGASSPVAASAEREVAVLLVPDSSVQGDDHSRGDEITTHDCRRPWWVAELRHRVANLRREGKHGGETTVPALDRRAFRPRSLPDEVWFCICGFLEHPGEMFTSIALVSKYLRTVSFLFLANSEAGSVGAALYERFRAAMFLRKVQQDSWVDGGGSCELVSSSTSIPSSSSTSFCTGGSSSSSADEREPKTGLVSTTYGVLTGDHHVVSRTLSSRDGIVVPASLKGSPLAAFVEEERIPEQKSPPWPLALTPRELPAPRSSVTAETIKFEIGGPSGPGDGVGTVSVKKPNSTDGEQKAGAVKHHSDSARRHSDSARPVVDWISLLDGWDAVATRWIQPIFAKLQAWKIVPDSMQALLALEEKIKAQRAAGTGYDQGRVLWIEFDKIEPGAEQARRFSIVDKDFAGISYQIEITRLGYDADDRELSYAFKVENAATSNQHDDDRDRALPRQQGQARKSELAFHVQGYVRTHKCVRNPELYDEALRENADGVVADRNERYMCGLFFSRPWKIQLAGFVDDIFYDEDRALAVRLAKVDKKRENILNRHELIRLDLWDDDSDEEYYSDSLSNSDESPPPVDDPEAWRRLPAGEQQDRARFAAFTVEWERKEREKAIRQKVRLIQMNRYIRTGFRGGVGCKVM